MAGWREGTGRWGSGDEIRARPGHKCDVSQRARAGSRERAVVVGPTVAHQATSRCQAAPPTHSAVARIVVAGHTHNGFVREYKLVLWFGRIGIICIEGVNADDLQYMSIRSDFRRPIKNQRPRSCTMVVTVFSITIKRTPLFLLLLRYYVRTRPLRCCRGSGSGLVSLVET